MIKRRRGAAAVYTSRVPDIYAFDDYRAFVRAWLDAGSSVLGALFGR